MTRTASVSGCSAPRFPHERARPAAAPPAPRCNYRSRRGTGPRGPCRNWLGPARPGHAAATPRTPASSAGSVGSPGSTASITAAAGRRQDSASSAGSWAKRSPGQPVHRRQSARGALISDNRATRPYPDLLGALTLVLAVVYVPSAYPARDVSDGSDVLLALLAFACRSRGGPAAAGNPHRLDSDRPRDAGRLLRSTPQRYAVFDCHFHHGTFRSARPRPWWPRRCGTGRILVCGGTSPHRRGSGTLSNTAAVIRRAARMHPPTGSSLATSPLRCAASSANPAAAGRVLGWQLPRHLAPLLAGARTPPARWSCPHSPSRTAHNPAAALCRPPGGHATRPAVTPARRYTGRGASRTAILPPPGDEARPAAARTSISAGAGAPPAQQANLQAGP